MNVVIGLLILLVLVGLTVTGITTGLRWFGRRHPERRVLFDAYEEAYDHGFVAGLRIGQEAGESAGRDAGFVDGWTRGRAQAFAEAEQLRRRELGRLAADALPLCWPDEHPGERAEQANRLTGELLALIEQARSGVAPQPTSGDG